LHEVVEVVVSPVVLDHEGVLGIETVVVTILALLGEAPSGDD
jgi:hypothetical protein